VTPSIKNYSNMLIYKLSWPKGGILAGLFYRIPTIVPLVAAAVEPEGVAIIAPVVDIQNEVGRSSPTQNRFSRQAAVKRAPISFDSPPPPPKSSRPSSPIRDLDPCKKDSIEGHI